MENQMYFIKKNLWLSRNFVSIRGYCKAKIKSAALKLNNSKQIPVLLIKPNERFNQMIEFFIPQNTHWCTLEW